MKTMTNTRKIARISALLLVLCMISTVMIGGTFAKYTSEYSGQDTALVARWSFTAAQVADATSTGETLGTNTELELFDHAYDTHINQNAADGKFILAPGVSDDFTLSLDYLADVDADVSISIDTLAGSAVVPVEYSVDNGANWKTLAQLPDALAAKIAADSASFVGDSGSSITDANTSDKTIRIANVDNNSTTKVQISETVKWRWAYDAAAQSGQGAVAIASNDTTDTNLGIASYGADGSNRTSYGIKITLRATQVAPTTEPVTIGAITNAAGTLSAGALNPVDATATYQWQISDTINGSYTAIPGATDNSYIPAGNSGKYVKVVATGVRGTVVSAAFLIP